MLRLCSPDYLITLHLHSTNILLVLAEKLIYTFIYVSLTFSRHFLYVPYSNFPTSFIYVSVTLSLHFLYTPINALLTLALSFIFIFISNILLFTVILVTITLKLLIDSFFKFFFFKQLTDYTVTFYNKETDCRHIGSELYQRRVLQRSHELWKLLQMCPRRVEA